MANQCLDIQFLPELVCAHRVSKRKKARYSIFLMFRTDLEFAIGPYAFRCNYIITMVLSLYHLHGVNMVCLMILYHILMLFWMAKGLIYNTG